MKLTVVLVLVLLLCLAAGAFELHRALSGNELSWLYTFEWPGFAIYAIYMYRRLLQEERAEVAAAHRRALRSIGGPSQSAPVAAATAPTAPVRPTDRRPSDPADSEPDPVGREPRSVDPGATTPTVDEQIANELASWRRGIDRRTGRPGRPRAS